MDDRYRTLCHRLPELASLDEGRRDPTGVLTRASLLVQELLGSRWSYAAIPVDGGGLVARAVQGETGARSDAWEGPGPYGQRVLQSRETLPWSQGDGLVPSRLDVQDDRPVRHLLGTPIPLPDRSPGLLVAGRDTDRFGPHDAEILEVVARTASQAMANIRTFQEVESLAVTDDLTRVYNYRFLKAALRREVDRAARYGHAFSIIMIDVDHLKLYNEVHGHLQGSEVLRRLAAILSGSSRAIDLVAKYGGDEFLIILPQTRTDGALIMGNRVCESVAAAAFPHCRQGDMTVSVGLATFPEHGTTMESLLAAADEALFRAKRSGRNCVQVADAPGRPGRIAEVA